MNLRLDWCSHEAAKYAVEHWHYSGRLPVGKMIKVGAWEDGVFIGCIIFSRGANNAIGKEFGLEQTEVCELVRVALRQHSSSVSRIVAIALRMAHKQSPGIRLVVSYADPREGHTGAIYQAGNWIYAGVSQGSVEFFHEGRWKHNREITSGAFGGERKLADYSHLPKRKTGGKHKYLMPLDLAMRAKILPLARPYPKRVGSDTIDTAGVHSVKGGETPTPTLQS